MVNLVAHGLCDGCKKRSATQAPARESSTQRGYGYRWQQYTAARLRREPLCEGLRLRPDGPVMVNTHPGRVVAATLTDHIVPHRGDMKLFWDVGNHQSGCEECHDVKTAKFDGGFGRKAIGISNGGRGGEISQTFPL